VPITISSSALIGIHGTPVEVEVEVATGIPAVRIVGLPDAAVGEARERIRAAIRSSGHIWPARRITVNLAPADLRKTGGSFDLPIALGILAASGQIQLPSGGLAAVGELALDGRVRNVPGSGPLVSALHVGSGMLLAPAGANAALQAVQADVGGRVRRLVVVASLREAVAVLAGRTVHEFDTADHTRMPEPQPISATPFVDLAEVRGQPLAARAVLLAAVCRLPLLLEGAPGVGKSLAARALHGILPDLSAKEHMEVQLIASAGGFSAPHNLRPPLRTPHHDLTVAGMIGGGPKLTPGELTWAHRGVLILDEIGEFRRDTLEALREPIERGSVDLARAGRSTSFPADTLIVATGNPCSCGELQRPEDACRCGPSARRRGSLALSAPLRDRFAIKVRLGRPNRPLAELPRGELSTVEARRMVAQARAEIPPPSERDARVAPSTGLFVGGATSGRGWTHLRDLSLASALLDGRETPSPEDIAVAQFFAGHA